MSMVEWGNHEISIKKQAELLGLNRSSLYYRPVEPSPEEIAIKKRIDEIYTQYPFFGSPRIATQLNREGFGVNRKAVQRHMRDMGISGICLGPNLSRRNQENAVFPYLLREVTIDHPDQVWGVDNVDSPQSWVDVPCGISGLVLAVHSHLGDEPDT